MTGRYFDFEELRLPRERSRVPDEIVSNIEGDPRRQRVARSSCGYPDRPIRADDECRSCGAPVPPTRTKCRFCLVNRGDDSWTRADGATTDRSLVGIVHMVVGSATFYGAVAKGSAATRLLASKEDKETIDDCTLVYDLDEEPASQLTDRWPSLPSAVRVESADGEELLAAARPRTDCGGRSKSEKRQETSPRLFDESGSSIRDESRLQTVLDDVDEEAWLVPAIALQSAGAGAGAGEGETSSECAEGPVGGSLRCQCCERVTEHRLRTRESAPDGTLSGQSIWECRLCGRVRYGPGIE